MVCLLGSVWYIVSSSLVRKANEIVLADLELTNIADGTYKGEYALSPVKVVVQVQIKDQQIQAIDILEHENGLGKKAEAITGRVIEAQNLDVDAISGATVSSKVILKAVDNALNK